MVTDEFQRLMSLLENDHYRQIAMWKLEGLTNKEVGEKLGCAQRTVTNRLDIIRKTFLVEEQS